MPTSPRGVRFQSGQRKRTRPYRQPRADVGIGPYKKTTCVPSVGGDAHIAPWGMSPERSRKTDTSIPLASGPMRASAPTKKTCVFSVGGDVHIAPWGMSSERSEETDTPIPSASGPMRASAPTKYNVRFQRRGRRLSGQKKRTHLFCRQPAWRMQLPCRYPKERS